MRAVPFLVAAALCLQAPASAVTLTFDRSMVGVTQSVLFDGYLDTQPSSFPGVRLPGLRAQVDFTLLGFASDSVPELRIQVKNNSSISNRILSVGMDFSPDANAFGHVPGQSKYFNTIRVDPIAPNVQKRICVTASESCSFGSTGVPLGQVDKFDFNAIYNPSDFSSKFSITNPIIRQVSISDSRLGINNATGLGLPVSSVILYPTRPPEGLVIERNFKQFDPKKPTVIVTHGWQPFSGSGSRPPWPNDIAEAIDRLGGAGKVNIITPYWSGANTLTGTADALRKATAEVSNVGVELARRLSAEFGSPQALTGGIHFVGHSLGSLVNAYAANFLVRSGYDIDQFTILDRPFGKGIRTDNVAIPVGGDADGFIFRTLLPARDVKFVDNYYGGISVATPPNGAPATGASFAPDANALNIFLADRDHGGVHQYYLQSVGTSCNVFRDAGFGCSLAGGGLTAAAKLFPWNPKTESTNFPSKEIRFDLNKWLTLNCEFNDVVSNATCNERSPAYLWVNDFSFDENVEFLKFDFAWHNLGDGDWLTLHFNDVLLYSGLGSLFDIDEFYSSGFLPVTDLAGQTGQLLFTLNSVGDANASFSIRNIVTIGRVAAVPEPASWAMLICGFGLVGAVQRRRRMGIA